ncbi:MAG: tetratricopeptide repeat protein [Armatimonadota bacterium]|jgi:Ca-activated chloride channel family protein
MRQRALTTRRLSLAALLLCAPLVVAWGVPRRVASAVKRGNAAYHKENYDQALREYAGIEDPGPAEPIVRFNSGDALYKKGSHKAAVEEYQRALGSGSDFDASVHYNIGNAAFRMGKLDEAIAGYKRALELHPSDARAKHNLEWALRARQEQMQQQPEQGQDQERQDGEEQDGGQRGKGEQRDTEPRPSQGQQQQAEPQGAQPQQKQPAQPAQMSLTPAEAVRLLRAAASDDREVQKQILRMQMEPVPEQTPEKDW